MNIDSKKKKIRRGDYSKQKKMSMLKKLQDEIDWTCKLTSRYLKYKETELNTSQLNNKSLMQVCPFCGSDYAFLEQRIRLRSKVRCSKKHERLLKRFETDSKNLGKYQLNMVQNYLNSYNQLMVTCSVCNKTMKYPCLKRSDLMQRKKPSHQCNTVDSEINNDVLNVNKKKKKRKKKKNESIKSLTESHDEITREDDKGLQFTKLQVGQQAPVSPMTSQTVYNVVSIKQTALNITHKKPEQDKKPIPSLSKSAKKKKGKNIHQQLNKMLAKDKTEKKSGSLMDFLSTL